MNKLLKLSMVAGFAAYSIFVQAQDNPTSLKNISDKDAVSVTKKLNMRIYGGPSMDFMYEGEHSVMKGGRFGMNGGFEVNKTFSKRAYGIIGIGITSGGFERWINDDPSVKSKTSFDQITALEVPIGLGFNLGKESPRGFFTNFTLINSVTLRSESNFTIVPFGSFAASSNQVNNTFDNFNLGARAEFGIKTKFEGNSYAAFSLAPRAMFYNRFSTNTKQFTGLSIAALMSFYF
ncbi:MAG: hypothetical protein JNL75_01720 [Chitinophagales bacterium]|nr:hypothetical protein [Chitinophagales bacterium]